MERYLKKGKQLPTAFFCMNDIIAYGCIKALRDRGHRVPEDISITGFDDLPSSGITEPPLTTVRVSAHQIGERALERLSDKIDGLVYNSPEKILIACKLIVRGSVKKISGGTAAGPAPFMKILVFGSLNIDLIFSVDHIAAPGETISSSSLARSAGGKGANQAAALAKAGMPVYMAGKIGPDGEFLLSLLESYGVNTGRVVKYEGATGQAIIQLDQNKQNAIVLYSGGNGAITIGEIYQTIGEFGAGDLIVLQNEIVHVREIMECAKERGLRICLNPSPCNEKIAALPLDLVDLFFVNEIEGAALAELPSDTAPPAALDRLVKRFPRAEIILTAGKDGAYYGCGETRAKGNIVDLPVADTTAAGDTFTGYFIAAREKNMPVPQALALACKASSIAVSREGAMESIPLATEVFD